MNIYVVGVCPECSKSLSLKWEWERRGPNPQVKVFVELPAHESRQGEPCPGREASEIKVIEA